MDNSTNFIVVLWSKVRLFKRLPAQEIYSVIGRQLFIFDVMFIHVKLIVLCHNTLLLQLKLESHACSVGIVGLTVAAPLAAKCCAFIFRNCSESGCFVSVLFKLS